MGKKSSTWNNINKKRGFVKSVGRYVTKDGDRMFVLYPANPNMGKKGREYSSPKAAERDGWRKE